MDHFFYSYFTLNLPEKEANNLIIVDHELLRELDLLFPRSVALGVHF